MWGRRGLPCISFCPQSALGFLQLLQATASGWAGRAPRTLRATGTGRLWNQQFQPEEAWAFPPRAVPGAHTGSGGSSGARKPSRPPGPCLRPNTAPLAHTLCGHSQGPGRLPDTNSPASPCVPPANLLPPVHLTHVRVSLDTGQDGDDPGRQRGAAPAMQPAFRQKRNRIRRKHAHAGSHGTEKRLGWGAGVGIQGLRGRAVRAQ